MPLKDLRAFVQLLESRGELRRVRAPVDLHLELAEIADRVMKRGGPALLFENVVGHSVPVLINAFGSTRRMAWALGVDDLEQHAARIRKLLTPALPDTLMGKLRALGDLRQVATAQPKLVARGPCQEVVEPEPSLERLPVITCWPGDGGPYITLGLVITAGEALLALRAATKALGRWRADRRLRQEMKSRPPRGPRWPASMR